jgi:hypothetical protein
MDPIPLVIIASPMLDRSAPLLKSLKPSSIFEIIKLDATVGAELSAPKSLVTTQELVSFGRVLTQNERACAISHSRAREIIKNSNFGGVILEDDARILNLEMFEKIICEFLVSQRRQKKILSLVQYHGTNNQGFLSKEQNRLFRLPGSFPLAVAYTLTPKAAEELNFQSKKRSGISDWPDSSCTYYFLRSGLVRHGDEQTNSIIGQVEIRTSRIPDLIKKILTYSEVQMVPRNLVKAIKWKIKGKIAEGMINSRQQKG